MDVGYLQHMLMVGIFQYTYKLSIGTTIHCFWLMD